MAEQRRDIRDVRDAGEDSQGSRTVRRRDVPDDVARAWDELVATARRTVADGLVVGTSGNVSVRVGDTVLVTPTGVPYDRLAPDDVTGVDLSGRQVLGTLPPDERTAHASGGLPRHRRPRRRPHPRRPRDGRLHARPDELPLIHYMAAALGGPVRVAPYATYGTDELAENMLRALTDRTACLLQNHGTITYGDHPRPGVRPHGPAGVDVPRLADGVLGARVWPRPC